MHSMLTLCSQPFEMIHRKDTCGVDRMRLLTEGCLQRSFIPSPLPPLPEQRRNGKFHPLDIYRYISYPGGNSLSALSGIVCYSLTRAQTSSVCKYTPMWPYSANRCPVRNLCTSYTFNVCSKHFCYKNFINLSLQ